MVIRDAVEDIEADFHEMQYYQLRSICPFSALAETDLRSKEPGTALQRMAKTKRTALPT
jgi:hypothetical protein